MSKIARIPVSTSLPSGVPGVIMWARRTHPRIYRAVAARLAARGDLDGLGATDYPSLSFGVSKDPVVQAAASSPGVAQTVLNTFSELVKVGLPLYQQQKLFDLQIKRAQAGQPMLDAQALSDASAVRFGVDTSTKNTGLIIAGVLGGAFVLSKLIGRRGRR